MMENTPYLIQDVSYVVTCCHGVGGQRDGRDSLSYT